MSSILVTPARLLSELIVVHLKLWHTLEIAYDEMATDAEIGRAKRKICKLNTLRTKLENEIDKNFHDWFLGEDLFEYMPTLKDYSKSGKKRVAEHEVDG